MGPDGAEPARVVHAEAPGVRLRFTRTRPPWPTTPPPRSATSEAVPLREALWWHPVHTHDAAHIWLRGTAQRVGAELSRRGGDGVTV